jgi:hypothetical protein
MTTSKKAVLNSKPYRLVSVMVEKGKLKMHVMVVKLLHN